MTHLGTKCIHSNFQLHYIVLPVVFHVTISVVFGYNLFIKNNSIYRLDHLCSYEPGDRYRYNLVHTDNF